MKYTYSLTFHDLPQPNLYIGESVNPGSRLSTHLARARSGIHHNPDLALALLESNRIELQIHPGISERDLIASHEFDRLLNRNHGGSGMLTGAHASGKGVACTVDGVRLEFRSIEAAARHYGIDRGSISRILSGARKPPKRGPIRGIVIEELLDK